MYRSFTIDNFRGLRHLELPHIAPVTVLTGRNNVGKTAVLEALFLHAAGPRAALHLLTTLRPYRSASAFTNLEVTRRSTPWETAFYNRDVTNPIRLAAQINQRRITVELSTPRESSSSHVSSKLSADRTLSSVTSDAVPGFSYAMNIVINSSPKRPNQPSHEEFVQSLSAQIGSPFVGPSGLQQAGGVNLSLSPEQNSDVLVYASFLSPVGRAPQAELAQRYTTVRLRGLENNFLDALRAVEPALETVEILATGLPTLYFTIRGGPPLPLASMGEGMVAVANYAAAIFETPNSLLLIDEVENGIHYSALPELWRQIGRAVRKTGTQVIVSTHSYECVRAAYTAFHDEPSFLQLLRLQSGDDSPSAIAALDYDVETLEAALDMDLDLR